MGLSPQARGKLVNTFMRPPVQGPIPAGAGETWSPLSIHDAHGAYPRRRGGNIANASGPMLTTGLSPQARGKRLRYL